MDASARTGSGWAPTIVRTVVPRCGGPSASAHQWLTGATAASLANHGPELRAAGMARERVAPPELHTVERDAEAMGRQEGMDFFVAGIPSSASSETVGFAEVDGECCVTCRDKGHARGLVRTADLAAAREVSFEHVTGPAGPAALG